MSRRRIVLLVVLLVVVVGGYGYYQVSPFARHDKQAAAFEDRIRQRVASMDGVTVLDSDHSVSSNDNANGGYCWYYATVDVRTHDSPANVRAQLSTYDDEFLDSHVSAVSGHKDEVRVEASTLGEGGTVDLRCG